MTKEETAEKYDLQIQVYPDMAEISDDKLQQLALKEREWFGYGLEGRGFGEYAICSNENCRRILSVEDVYPNTSNSYISLEILEKDGINLPGCPDCNCSVEPLLDPKYFADYLKMYFAQKVYGALLMSGDEIKGAITAYKAPFQTAFEGNINYRKGYDLEKTIDLIAKITQKTKDEIRKMEICCCNRIGMDKDIRGQGHLAKLARAVLDQHPEFDELPSLGDAKITGPVYPLAVAAGYQPVSEDSYGNTLFYSDNFGKFRRFFSLTKEALIKEFGEKIKSIKSWQQERKKQDRNLSKPKSIKGVSLLRERFEKTNQDTKNVDETGERNKFIVEALSSVELNEQILKEISDFFRFIFNNSYGGQFLTYPSIARPISAHAIFGKDKNEYIPLNKLDNFDPSTYPEHPETHEKAIFWHDPEITIKRFTEKSAHNAHFALMRDIETNEIAGLMFGHKCTVRQVFESEEWQNPLYYSGIENPKQYRDFQNFLIKINNVLRNNGWQEIDSNTEIYGWNCVATRQDARGLENLLRMTKRFFEIIPDEFRDLTIIGETIHQSRAHALFRTGGALDVPGILVPGSEISTSDPQIAVASLEEFSKTFKLSPENFLLKMKKVLSS